MMPVFVGTHRLASQNVDPATGTTRAKEQAEVHDRRVPRPADLERVNLRLKSSAGNQDVTVYFSDDGKALYLFPTFSIMGMTVGGAKVEIKDGTLRAPVGATGAISIEISDLEHFNNYIPSLLAALGQEQRPVSGKRYLPAFQKDEFGTERWEAVLYHTAMNPPTIIGKVAFARGASKSFLISFPLEGEAKRLLAEGVPAASLVLSLRADYSADIIEDDLTVTAKALESALVQFRTNVFGDPAPTNKDLYVLAVGGSGVGVTRVEEELSRVIDVSIRTRNPGSDPVLSAKLMQTVIGEWASRRTLAALPQDAVGALLLSNNIVLTGAIGDLNGLLEKSRTQDETEIRKLLETFKERERGGSGGMNVSVSPKGFGGGAQAAYKSRDVDASKSEDELRTLAAKELHNEFHGKAPSVVGLHYTTSGALSGFSVDQITVTFERYLRGFANFAYPIELSQLDSISYPSWRTDSGSGEKGIGMVSIFPGTIEAAARLDSAGIYLLCDGEVLKRADYPELYLFLGNDPDPRHVDFRLPDYQGYFLRGHDPLRRIDTDAGRQLGNQQNWATAMPVAPFNIQNSGGHSHKGPMDEVHGKGKSAWPRPASGGGTQVTEIELGGGEHTHAIGGGDPETRPVNKSVIFVIRAK